MAQLNQAWQRQQRKHKMADEKQNKIEHKPEEKKVEHKPEAETKEEKKPEAKKIEVKKTKRNEAVINGLNLSMGYKVGADICSMIRSRDIDTAIKRVEEVIAFKRAVMTNKREGPHRHGKGMMAGRYPVKACADFLKLLKNLKANAIYHELELEKCIIFCKADKASQPYKRGGTRMKRTHVLIKLVKRPQQKSNKTGAKKI